MKTTGRPSPASPRAMFTPFTDRIIGCTNPPPSSWPSVHGLMGSSPSLDGSPKKGTESACWMPRIKAHRIAKTNYFFLAFLAAFFFAGTFPSTGGYAIWIFKSECGLSGIACSCYQFKCVELAWADRIGVFGHRWGRSAEGRILSDWQGQGPAHRPAPLCRLGEQMERRGMIADRGNKEVGTHSRELLCTVSIMTQTRLPCSKGLNQSERTALDVGDRVREMAPRQVSGPKSRISSEGRDGVEPRLMGEPDEVGDLRVLATKAVV